jgi:hypothetical protein
MSHRHVEAVESIWGVLKKAQNNKYGRQRYEKALKDIEIILVLTESRLQDDLEAMSKEIHTQGIHV